MKRKSLNLKKRFLRNNLKLKKQRKKSLLKLSLMQTTLMLITKNKFMNFSQSKVQCVTRIESLLRPTKERMNYNP